MLFARVKTGGPGKAYRYVECPKPADHAKWTYWRRGDEREQEREHVYAVYLVRGRSGDYPRCQAPGELNPGAGLLWIRVTPLTKPGVEAVASMAELSPVWRVEVNSDVYACIPLPPGCRRIALDGVVGVAAPRFVVKALEEAFGDAAFVARELKGGRGKIVEKVRGIFINDEAEAERLKCPFCGVEGEYYFPSLGSANTCNCGAGIVLSPVDEVAETVMALLDAFTLEEVEGKYRTVRLERDEEAVAVFLQPQAARK
jgi:hypothetical protein